MLIETSSPVIPVAIAAVEISRVGLRAVLHPNRGPERGNHSAYEYERV